MARGGRGDRSRPPPATTPAGRNASSRAATPPEYDDIEFDQVESADTAPPAAALPAVGGSPPAARTEDHAMTQPDDGRESTPRYQSPIAPPDESPAPPAEPPRRRGGSGFLAGLIGGLLASAAVLAGAGWYAYERGPIRPTLERLAATESSARNAESGVSDLGGQFQEVRGDLDAVGGAVEAGAGAVGQLEQRVAANERVTGELAARLEQAGTSFRTASDQVIGRLEEMNTRLAEVARAQPADIVDKGTVADLVGKQAGIAEAQGRLEGSLARVEQLVAQGLEAGNQQGEALRVVVDDSRTRLDEVAASVVALTALRGELARQQAVDNEQRAAVQATDQQLATVRTELEQDLQDVAGRLGELDKQRERSVGMSIAVDNLGAALETGEPFQPTLDVLGQLGGGDPVVGGAVGKLQAMAGAGVATTAELAQQLGDVEGSLSAPPAQAPSQDWLARTRANLDGLVNLQSADAEAVPGIGAVQAARQAVLVQDLRGAVQALEPLRQAGNQQAAAWITAASARLDAEAALQNLRQHVKTLLAQQD